MSQAPDGNADGTHDDPLTVQAAENLQSVITSLRAELQASEARSATALEAENANRRRSQRRTWATVLLDVGLSLISLLLWHNQYVTAQQQADTRVKVLCPLYSVLLASAANPRPAAPQTAAQKAQFDASVKVIRDGYTALGCVPPLTK